MRTLLLGSLALSAATLWAADPAQPEAVPATPAPAAAVPAAEPAAAKLTPEQEKQAFAVQGYIMAQQLGISRIVKDLRMDEAEVAALLQGMGYAAQGKELPFKFDSLIAGAQVFFNERAAVAAAAHAEQAKEWGAANTAFLTKVDADQAVTKTASGLRYQILEAGAAEKPAATSTVKAHYVGKLCDGTIFDSTDKNGGEPVEFPLSGVIKGWTEGLQLIGKGGKIRLWIPAEIGYGNQDGGPIPAGSVLDFEVELVDFK